MIFDGYVHQLPDIDPTETQEWLDSLDAVVETHGKARARFLLSKLLDRASASQVSFPATVSTTSTSSDASVPSSAGTRR
jgi:pyruvate dehydrogenase E1 component